MQLEEQEYILAKRPEDGQITGETLILQHSSAVEELKEGEILVRTTHLSIDPYMRVRMSTELNKNVGPLALGESPSGIGLGQVVESRHPNFVKGDYLSSWGMQWKTLQVLPGDGQTKIESKPGVELPMYLGVLGLNGITAYLSLKTVYPNPKAGDVAYVSAAAGAVGSLVGQLLKSWGLTVIGSASSQEKLDYLKSIGYDHVFNYKGGNIKEKLQAVAPNGIDLYYDLVGGESLEAAIEVMNFYGTIINVGYISGYEGATYGVENLKHIFTKEITMKGWLIFSYMDEIPQGTTEMLKLVQANGIHAKTHVVHGFGELPQAFRDMMAGKNIGKTVIEL